MIEISDNVLIFGQNHICSQKYTIINQYSAMKYTLLLSFLIPCVAFGQASFRHLDKVELEKLKAARTEHAAKGAGPAAGDVPLTMFMRVSDDETVGRVEAAGAEVTLRAGDIIIVETTLAAAESLAATEGVVTVSLPEELTVNSFSSNVGYDSSRSYLGLDKISAGMGESRTPYLGQGVIVGVIDAGIDPNHIMFDDEDGNPRVKRIINHVQVGSNRLTQKVETPEAVRKFTTDANSLTHGTHVVGIAAGGFDAGADGPDLGGAAPKADIAIKCGMTDNARLIQGLRYLVYYALAEEKPLVVNISLGSNEGPHDGTDEFPAALQEFASMEGVTICVSSGNEGAEQAFMYHEFAGQAPMKTFVAPSMYTDLLYSQVSMLPLFPQAIGSMEIWADDETPFDLYVDLYSLAGGSPELRSSFRIEPFKTSYLTTGGAPAGTDVVKDDDELFNSQYVKSFFGGATGVYPANNRYYAELNFQLECPDAATYQGGIMSLRVEPGKPGQKIYVYGQPLGSYFGFSLLSGGFESAGFSGSYADGSVNSMAGAKDVVTVGSYVSHNFNADVASQYTVGTTSVFSSWGHTPDGRLHPLVSAPGNFIVSAMSSYYYDAALKGTDYASDERYVYYGHTASDGKTHYWTPMSGTSMASPYMAGIFASWLSADPGLTTADLVGIAQETADRPSVASHNDGPGFMVNAYRGLCRVLGISGVSEVAADADVPYVVNRSGNVLTVSAPGASSMSAWLYTAAGAPALRTAADGGTLRIDASALSPGVYVMRLDVGGSTHSEKVAII